MAASDLTQALSRELAAGRDFEALLQSEFDALMQPGPDRLRELAAKKVQLAAEVSALASARNETLTRSGLPRGRQGIALACSKSGSEAKGVLDQLMQCARRVRDFSQRNEILINMRLQQVSAALNVLQRSDSGAQIYSADGRARSSTGRLARTTA